MSQFIWVTLPKQGTWTYGKHPNLKIFIFNLILYPLSQDNDLLMSFRRAFSAKNVFITDVDLLWQ